MTIARVTKAVTVGQVVLKATMLVLQLVDLLGARSPKINVVSAATS